MKIRKDDQVKITLGKYKGKTGKVEKVFAKENMALIPGINEFKRHIKGKYGQKSEITTITKPMVISKMALICPKCKKETRVGYKIEQDKKIRICRKCKKEI